MCKRINRLSVNIHNHHGRRDEDDGEYIIIAIDSTGIKVTNRGQWMDKKRNIQNRKCYLKIHIAVNIKTKEIIALEVPIDEKVHDGKMKSLVDQVSIRSSDKKKNKTIRIKSVLADGAFDTNRNFVYLGEKSIKPGIKVRKNSIVSSTRNNRLGNQ